MKPLAPVVIKETKDRKENIHDIDNEQFVFILKEILYDKIARWKSC